VIVGKILEIFRKIITENVAKFYGNRLYEIFWENFPQFRANELSQ